LKFSEVAGAVVGSVNIYAPELEGAANLFYANLGPPLFAGIPLGFIVLGPAPNGFAFYDCSSSLVVLNGDVVLLFRESITSLTFYFSDALIILSFISYLLLIA
jgi:hypothetical protein